MPQQFTLKEVNYREQDIKCCHTCKHSRKYYDFVCENENIESTLRQFINPSYICDLYEE